MLSLWDWDLQLLLDMLSVPGGGVFSYHAQDRVPVVGEVWAFSDGGQDSDMATTAAPGSTFIIEGALPHIAERVQIQAVETHKTLHLTKPFIDNIWTTSTH